MRSVLERVARGVGVLGVVAALWLVLWPRDLARDEVVDGVGLRAALVRWTTAPVGRVRVVGVPSAVGRDWLRAIRQDGAAVSWSGSVGGVAVSAEPEADPAGVVRVAVAAPAGAMVTVGDATGAIDSMRAAGGGATFDVPGGGVFQVSAGGVVARGAVRDTLVWRPLLVVGPIGWESKFVARALEERGWVVRRRLAISPKTVLQSPAVLPLDSARYGAIVSLDSASKSHSDTTWRWRMRGDVEGHRRWWARWVAEAAALPRVEIPVRGDVDPAPVAAVVGELGEPVADRGAERGWEWNVVPWLFGVIVLGFLVEWVSRRLRGAE
jgi:hypothetical protein